MSTLQGQTGVGRGIMKESFYSKNLFGIELTLVQTSDPLAKIMKDKFTRKMKDEVKDVSSLGKTSSDNFGQFCLLCRPNFY